MAAFRVLNDMALRADPARPPSALAALDLPSCPTPSLAVLRLELTFVMDDPVVLPANRGNLWRGVLGPSLKRLDEGVLPGLSTGLLATGTLYDSFFDPQVPAGGVAGAAVHEGAPHPYVVDAPAAYGLQTLVPGASERIGLTLIGRPATAVEAVLAAFDFAARRGLGVGQGPKWQRGRAHLREARAVWRNAEADVTVFDPSGGYRPIMAEVPLVPPCPPRLRVILATPLRLLRNGMPIGPDQFEPGLLVASLVRRVTALSALYGDIRLEPDVAALKSLSRGLVARDAELVFADQTRWSGNHRQEIVVGGIIGSFTLDMNGSEALFPYLWLSQWLHAGKSVVSGLGAIRLRPA